MNDKYLDFEEFNRIIQKIKRISDFQNNLSEICIDYNHTNRMGDEVLMYFPSLESVCLDLLNYIFEDESGWIGYFIYELNYGENYIDGCIVDENEQIVKLRNTKDLYKLLVTNLLNKTK